MVSLYDYWAAPEPEYSDDEWDRAEDLLWQERRDLGWDDEQIAAHVDDWLIAEKCDALRADRDSMVADEERARRKESW